MSQDEHLNEAKKRFKRSQDWEANARLNFENDVKFANGDAYNMYQWPMDIASNRRSSDRPCLTTNIIRQHNLNIKNDAAQNKPGIKFRATGNGATKKSADVWNAIAMEIERSSNFQSILDVAVGFQVDGGVGYWRVVTEYENENSFNQVVRLRPIPDPLAVFLDPDCQEADKSDMKFAFIFNDMLKEDFKRKYPQYANEAFSSQTYLGEGYDWIGKDHIRVAEYFYIEEKADKLLLIEDGDNYVTILRSQINRATFRQLKDDDAVRVRDVITKSVKWNLIAGNKVVEERDWPGKYIPIVQVVGEEYCIDGMMDRRGHTRAMLDAQRMYNYWNSAGVEFGALQTKTPWVTPARAVAGHEDEWAKANTENLAYLLYNDIDDDGNPVAPPKRTEPPVQSMAYVQGAQMARQEIMMVSGQYENQMGEPGNERTGKAISERQRQGDKATAHFINNLALGIRYTGLIMYDLVPKIYDTKRIMQLMGEDGVEFNVLIDPGAKQAWEKKKAALEYDVDQIFNPSIGDYAVYADVGPGYATRREEAWNAFNNILTQSPQLVSLIGDLLLAAGDFPLAQEAAERLRRVVPPAALGEGPTPAEQQAQMQLQELQQKMAQLSQENAMLRISQKSKEDSNIVSMYGKQTERLKTLSESLAIPPEVLVSMLGELIEAQVQLKMEEQQVTQAQRSLMPATPEGADAEIAAAAAQPNAMSPLAGAFAQGLQSVQGNKLGVMQ